MDTSFDLNFAKNTEAIVTQFGFKDLKSFIKNQALLMLMGRIEKYEAEIKSFEKKYNMPYDIFKDEIEKSTGEEDFAKEEDYLDWRFAKETSDRLLKQKRELERA